ncbi:single-stranded-DNA-specific exonuclease RecJ [Clostridium sp. BSD9I1]|uniref:single-stranded-DNA-specific exonuclease RecJ n=1 Tax=Clostridium sp. BSD9I1 TaxID=2003589 RepID=UPI001647D53E|nr:single-stranded-DNA-specific exonuclease RecJ [Clostridium sp. BSD9I1]
MKSKWMLKCTSSNVKALAQEIGVNETIINVLINRGIKTSRDIKKFVDASLKDLYNPFFMIDMDKGVDIIKEAIDMKRKIAIYGDYDADGVTSTVILYKALKRLGGNFIYHIPDREAEGYGMNLERIRHLKEDGVEIILSCDNGISAIDQIAYAKELGMKVVVTDHHELTFKEEDGERNYILPSADAVINPKRLDCTYPFKLLCGAGIAFKFVQALYSVFNIPENEVLEFLEYAAIGTICDVVDLVDENRIIAKNGLRLIRDTKNMGLNAIIKETSINKDTINSYHIGFIIGPCINATGRLETAKLSVELLLTEDEEAAKGLAIKLHQLNMERQEMTIKSVEEIESIVENSSLKNDKVLVIYKENVHESIAGIAAGRIREKYNLPTIILTKGKDMPKGSGRSIENYNMFEELLKCKEFLDKFGGHPMAAGLSLKEENIELLRRKLNENCILTKEDLIRKISIDRRMKLSEVCVSLIKELNILEPFGKGNASPVFAEKNVDIYKMNFIGKDKNTLKFSLKIDGSYNKIDALCFGKGDEFKEYIKQYFGDDYLDIIDNPKNLKMDFIFYPSLNDYNGCITPQLRIVDYRISGK